MSETLAPQFIFQLRLFLLFKIISINAYPSPEYLVDQMRSILLILIYLKMKLFIYKILKWNRGFEKCLIFSLSTR